MIERGLSEEEYYLITAQDEGDDIEIEIKFKIVEMFQKSKIKIASAMIKYSNDGYECKIHAQA